MAVFVDSSVWIAAQNPKGQVYKNLSQLIIKDELIYTADIVQTELAQGARSEGDFHKIWNNFLGFEFLKIEKRHWEMSAWHYFKARRRGLTVGTIDCLIATLAHDYRVPLWSLDHDHVRLQPIIGFEAFNPRYSK